MTAPYVRVAMKATHHCDEFLPQRAILSPGFMPVSLYKMCSLAILRATSLYDIVVEPRSVRAGRSQLLRIESLKYWLRLSRSAMSLMRKKLVNKIIAQK